MKTANSEQMDMMLHALGAAHPDSPLGWRNYYLADANDAQLGGLVAQGLMRRGQRSDDLGGDCYYCVTSEGIEFLEKFGYKIEIASKVHKGVKEFVGAGGEA